MSLAGQISHTVTTLSSARAARREDLGRIRTDAARHLSDARAAQRQMASEQQHRLTEALRSMKLGTAILLGSADERIDGYRKDRIKQAVQLDRALAAGLKTLRSDTRKWMSTQLAMRRKEAAENLRQRRRDRQALSATMRELMARNLAFLEGLTKDRQEASVIWLGRAAAAHQAPAAHHAKAEPMKAQPLKAEPMKAEPLKAEPIKAEPAKGDAPHHEPAAKVEAKVESKPAAEIKPAAQKPAVEKAGSGKSE
ncbi:MAG: hypothetical protein B7Y12_02935 [Rhizobiales bacterium 24-66-13]|jgi:hypothetical protein|nr:MAG: hypothetical protein B7Y61_09155 [Rhizobiales bacterium 35-66-30]OYZ82619.1 MAG: hypothetical protein B7Y12_02935 [Rhizobiales bacterium 24-66-13]OZB11619.1 MAG: hypothetical protein B7X67_03190 [Rhizobiales bacterium 39-66-18]HQS47510.1 hypothetical protein [Xanthobacteraceae bacterium]